jgi:hypothetical protein
LPLNMVDFIRSSFSWTVSRECRVVPGQTW